MKRLIRTLTVEQHIDSKKIKLTTNTDAILVESDLYEPVWELRMTHCTHCGEP